jgi:LAO/AO transport system kinase
MGGEADLLERVEAGDLPSLSRLCRRLGEGLSSDATREALHTRARGHWTIGVTGSPGAGKSTLVSRLVRAFRERGLRVGVVAVDPSSPFSGGAILGDRIRMQEHDEDREVFVRSLATRGTHGGLASPAEDVSLALALWGAHVVLVETVGVGQAELDVMDLADTVLVVVAPGMGDDVQAAKAGILEIADVLVVNKSDKPEAARTLAELQAMLALSHVTGSSRNVGGHTGHAKLNAATEGGADQFATALHACSAESGSGIPEMLASLDAHRAWLSTPHGEARLGERRASRLRSRFEELVLATFDAQGESVLELAGSVARGERTFGAALALLRARFVRTPST